MKLKKMTSEQKALLGRLNGQYLNQLVVDINRLVFVLPNAQLDLWSVNAYIGELKHFEVSGLCPELSTQRDTFSAVEKEGRGYRIVAEDVVVEAVSVVHGRLIDEWTETGAAIDEDLELGVLVKMPHGFLLEYCEAYSFFFSPENSRIIREREDVLKRMKAGELDLWLEELPSIHRSE